MANIELTILDANNNKVFFSISNEYNDCIKICRNCTYEIEEYKDEIDMTNFSQILLNKEGMKQLIRVLNFLGQEMQ